MTRICHRVVCMLDDGLNKTIKIFGSINRLAKKLGLPRVTISAWRNRNIRIPLERAYQIEWITNGEVAWEELVAPDIARIVKRCRLPLNSAAYQFETIYLSLSRIKIPNQLASIDLDHISDAVAELLKNIDENGLQKPICVDSKNHLIFGTKRLQAYQLSNKKTIPAWRLSLSDIINSKHSTQEIINIFSIEERSYIGLALEKQLAKRRGRHNPENFPEFKGKETREIVAVRLGYGNAKTYEQAKKIIQSGNVSLIHAMDSRQITISTAVALLKLSPEIQAQVLAQDAKSIIRFVGQLRSKQKAIHLSMNEANTYE